VEELREFRNQARAKASGDKGKEEHQNRLVVVEEIGVETTRDIG